MNWTRRSFPFIPGTASPLRRSGRCPLTSVDEAHRVESVAVTARTAGWLSRNGGGTVVLHTSFPAGQWYPHRWGAFLSSMNELLDAVPSGVRFAIENTPVDSGRVSVVLDIVDR